MSQEDPCADYGPNQRSAVVWFFAVISIGVVLGVSLATYDRGNYDAKGYIMRFDDHKENRLSATSLPSERQDERTLSSF